jgi:hypothetical protein
VLREPEEAKVLPEFDRTVEIAAERAANGKRLQITRKKRR